DTKSHLSIEAYQSTYPFYVYTLQSEIIDLTNAVKSALKKNDAAAAVKLIKEFLKDQNNIPLKIAITGKSGAGKSTFVNAFREMSDDDEGAALTGVTQTTLQRREYPHPNYPNVMLGDLPGIGTMKFPADEYLELVGFEKFDLFIIISDTCFRENEVKLAKEIQKIKKKFYFVRSKIDNDIQCGCFRLNIIYHTDLRERGIPFPQVFLVSSFERSLYDFPFLREIFERDLHAHKRDALLFAMSDINQKIINEKKETFQSKITFYATLSGAVAGVPLPGLSAAVDIGLIIKVVKEYVAGFGLDKPSLEKLASSSGVPYTDLFAVIKSPLAKREINKELILKILTQLASLQPCVKRSRKKKIFLLNPAPYLQSNLYYKWAPKIREQTNINIYLQS
uniref:IRG-type G domain-containing protein n=1 Tax=Haplochromis burtoni TaxID=8153 RepID=A0A3Q2WN06_HAPBU